MILSPAFVFQIDLFEVVESRKALVIGFDAQICDFRVLKTPTEELCA